MTQPVQMTPEQFCQKNYPQVEEVVFIAQPSGKKLYLWDVIEAYYQYRSSFGEPKWHLEHDADGDYAIFDEDDKLVCVTTADTDWDRRNAERICGLGEK